MTTTTFTQTAAATTYTPATIRESALTSASLCESLATNRTGLKVGPMRKSGPYQGRRVTFPVDQTVSHEYAVMMAAHAAHILHDCDGYEVSILADGVTLAVISRKPTA